MSESRLLRRLSSGQGLGSYGAVRDQERSLGARSFDVEMTKLKISEEKTRGIAKAVLCFRQSLLRAQS